MQFEPTIAAVETQLEIIKSLNEKIISPAESTPDELLDSQMYVFDTEAKLRRYRQNLRDHPSSSRAAVHEHSYPSSELQPPAISETSNQYSEDKISFKKEGLPSSECFNCFVRHLGTYLVLSKSITKTLMTHHAVFLTVITLNTCFRMTSALTL